MTAVKCPKCGRDIDHLNWMQDHQVYHELYGRDNIQLEVGSYEVDGSDRYKCPICDFVIATSHSEAVGFLEGTWKVSLMFDVSIAEVDWALLRKQKVTLLQVMDTLQTPWIEEDLQGIVNLLDSIQDQAAQVIGNNAVFGDDEETE